MTDQKNSEFKQLLSGARDALRPLLPKRLRADYSSRDLHQVVRAQIETGDYDVVQVEYLEMAHLAAPYIAGVPAVYTCHEAHNLLLQRLVAAKFQRKNRL